MTRSNRNTKYKKKNNLLTKRKKRSKINFDTNIYNLMALLFILIIVLCSSVFINYKITMLEDKIKKLNEEVTFENIAPHYVFLGDSITKQYELSKYFKGYSVINSGEDGNQTEHILKKMEERVFKYNPSTVFLMIGTNDIKDNKSVYYIFDNIRKIVDEIKINLPNTKIIVQAIVPSQENWGEHDNNKKRKKVNSMLEEEYKDSDVIYIDLYSMLEDKETGKLKDEYTEDGLHLNEKSYKIITKELKKYMTMKNKIINLDKVNND